MPGPCRSSAACSILARRFLPYVPAHLKQEMAAVAAGAQVSLGTMLLINVADDLANNTPRCSALAVGERPYPDGAYLMGRNLDYPVFIDVLVPLQTLFLLEPQRGTAPGLPGLAGICGGLHRPESGRRGPGPTLRHEPGPHPEGNARGHAFPAGSGSGGHRRGGGRPGLQALPGTIGNNLMLCDPGEALVLELSARRRRGAASGRPPHRHQPLSEPGHAGPERPLCAAAPLFAAGRRSFLRGLQRRSQPAAPRAGRRPPSGPHRLTKILADDGVANAGTAACAVFAPGDETIWVAQGQKPPVNRGSFVAIKLWS